jgi:hypothetical protein
VTGEQRDVRDRQAHLAIQVLDELGGQGRRTREAARQSASLSSQRDAVRSENVHDGRVGVAGIKTNDRIGLIPEPARLVAGGHVDRAPGVATGDDGAVQRRMMAMVAATALAVAVLSGCGDDDDAAPTTTATDAPETATARSSNDTAATGSTISAADATESDYLAAIERSLSTGDGLTTTAAQAECMAPKWLDTIGIERLKEHDVAPAQIGDDVNDDGSALSDLGLTEDEGNRLYDAFGDCDVDIRQEFVEFAAEGQSTDVASCIDDALTPDLLRRLMVSSIVQEEPTEELSTEFGEAIAPCDELAGGSTATTAA